MLAIAVPWLCVLGGVYAENVIVQPLTDYIWLGGGTLHDDRLLFISRLFGALKLGIPSLGEYYRSIQEDLEKPKFLHPAGFPFIQEYPLNNRSKNQLFT
jgi:hypothetical protein